MKPYKCRNCAKVKRGVVYFFGESNPSCPQCDHKLTACNIIHLLIGDEDKRKIACERGQALWDEAPEKMPSFICSIPEAATCHDCLVAISHDLGGGLAPTRQPASMQRKPIE